jgi:glycosyltransferase involved in cell wall biosynthesis
MKKNIPDISIVVPVYKIESHIGRCAKSLFEQEADNVEYIFVNDCTPDRSMEVLREVMELYPHRIPQVKIIDHESNRGVSAARNTGLEAVEGELVCFVDGDDFVSPGYLGNFICGLAGADCCVCGFSMNDSVYCLSDRKYGKEDLGQCVYEIEGRGLLGVVWNKCFRMDVVRKSGIQFDEKMTYWEDRVFAMDYLLVAERIVVSEGVFYNYEDRSDSAVKQPIFFDSAIGYLCAMDRLLFRLRGTDYLSRVYQQAFIYIALCVSSVYVDLSDSRKDRMLLLRELERVMGNCPSRLSGKQLINYKIVLMYRILLLKSILMKDALLRILRGMRRMDIKLKN